VLAGPYRDEGEMQRGLEEAVPVAIAFHLVPGQ
jgi:hypothetical protein